MVCALSSDGPRATGAARTVCDVQADSPPNFFRPETASQTDRNESAQELMKNTKNTWSSYTSWTVRLLPSDTP
jgi:hypothetical protein